MFLRVICAIRGQQLTRGRFILVWHENFLPRLTVLLALLAAVAVWDWRRHGKQARRWREYLFLLGCGGAGALVGVINDQITARISPEYFIRGKGIERGEQFWPGVAALAMEAGFTAGAVLGALLLVAGTFRGKSSFSRLTVGCGFVVLAAIVGSLTGFLIAPTIGPVGAVAELAGEIEPERLASLHRVWCMHIGLYVGALTGTCASIVLLVCQRRRRHRRESASIGG